MMAATGELNFVAGEAKPTGAKLEIPEQGVNAVVDSNDIALSQELPEGDFSYFVNLCKNSANLAAHHFQPRAILKNGFLIKEYWPFASVDEAFAASLSFAGDFQTNMGKVVGMIPNHKKLDFMFTSGSKDFHVTVQPVTFERSVMNRQNIRGQANRVERERIDRRNIFAERLNKNFSVANALVFEADLMENEPPAGASLEKHFAELKQKTDEIKKLLIVK